MNGTREARCPAHADRSPSLTVSGASEVEGGGVVLHCHPGCDTSAVVAAAGLTMADLFEPSTGADARSREVDRYPSTDEGRPYADNDERLAALPVWLESYNCTRPHTAIGNRPPIEALNNLAGNNT